MTAQLDKIIEVFKEHLKALHDRHDEVTGQIIISKLMIVRSYALLDKIEAEQSAGIYCGVLGGERHFIADHETR
jgi:hypothetical protein